MEDTTKRKIAAGIITIGAVFGRLGDEAAKSATKIAKRAKEKIDNEIEAGKLTYQVVNRTLELKAEGNLTADQALDQAMDELKGKEEPCSPKQNSNSKPPVPPSPEKPS